MSSKKLLFKRTTTGRRILSTASLNRFEVLLSMMVLSAGQVLHQSSAGTIVRAAINGGSGVTVATWVATEAADAAVEALKEYIFQLISR
jgi:hypothetical protein